MSSIFKASCLAYPLSNLSGFSHSYFVFIYPITFYKGPCDDTKSF